MPPTRRKEVPGFTREPGYTEGIGYTLVVSHLEPEQERPAWELPLQALLAGDGKDRGEADVGEVGLHFELVASPAPSMARPGTPGGSGIRLRPVVRSHAGNWVRQGISWDRLDHVGYGRARTSAEKVGLLKELLALCHLASTRVYYGYREESVPLEAVKSRRVWDLLHQAEDLHLPLLHSLRPALPVDLGRSPVEVVVDMTRGGTDVQLRARVDTDDGDVPLDSSLLIGCPPHGIAWWAASPESTGAAARLHLAPFSRPLSDAQRDLLAGAPVQVPRRDEERFWRDFFPTLSRVLPVRSSDESVELPEVADTALVLSVRHRDGHCADLCWQRGARGSTWREDLWSTARGPRDRVFEEAVAAATKIMRQLPGTVELTPFGERLSAEVQLAGMDAVVFVSELLAELAEVPGLEIDQTGTALDYREATAAPVVSLTGSESREGDWFDLTVEVSVGGEDVPFQELFVALAEGRSHLVLPSGTYFSLDRRELRELAELIAEARSLHDATGDGVRLSRFQAGMWEDLGRLGVITAQAATWEASVKALAHAGERVEHPVPDSLHATLRPYQQVGFDWLAFLYEHDLGGILADDMGLGKTLEALALMCHVRERGASDAPFLVVAPTSVVQNWAVECRRFAPGLAAVTVTETTGRRGLTLAEVAAKMGVVVTSYALFRLEYDEYESIEWAGLFLDEAQFAKNSSSHTYRRARTLPVPFKVAMTGTPMENNLMELWSLLSITAPGLFPRADRFEEFYRAPIERQGDTERLDRLRRRIRPLMLRRTKDQVVTDLPDKQEQVLELDLSSKHKKLYQTYLQRERQKVLGLLGDMTKNRFEIFRSLTLLRQASLDMSLVDPKHSKVPSTKLDALMEMLDEIVADGHRVLVFSQFTRYLTMARERLQAAGIDHCYLDGHTTKRAQVISGFRTGTAPVFLVSLKAGGFGLNLTEADYCVLLDPWWNPATEAQAVDRIHRIGQTRKVMVYRLVAKDTIEEKVMALKAKKAGLFANVIDAGGFEFGALTAADIRSLLS